MVRVFWKYDLYYSIYYFGTAYYMFYGSLTRKGAQPSIPSFEELEEAPE